MDDAETEKPADQSDETIPATTERIVFTQEQFRRLRTRRFQYLLLYGFIFLTWVFTRVAEYRGAIVPPELTYVVLACQALFYVQFVVVMSALRYSIWLILGICVVIIPPVPGLLILVAMDQQVYKLLDRATNRDRNVQGNST